MTASVSERIAALVEELQALEDPKARARSEEALRLLMELYGSALNRTLEIVYESAGAALIDALGDDELVGGLLVLHGIHPLSVEERALRALDRVRPYLGSHGGDASITRIADGVLYLTMKGSCDGCPSSAVTMKLSIEKAIFEAAPEIVRIEIEGESAGAKPASTLPVLAAAAAGG